MNLRFTCISGDNKLILLAKLDIDKINKLFMFLLIEGFGPGDRIGDTIIVSMNRQELKIGHGGNESISNITRLAKRVEIDTKIAL